MSRRGAAGADAGRDLVGSARELHDLFAELRARAAMPTLSRIKKRIEAGRPTTISTSYLSEILSGKKVPPGDTAANIAFGLGGTADEQRRARRHAESAALDRAARPSRHRTGTGSPPRSRLGYLDQAADIAPSGGLVDRQDELADLAAFCAGDTPYLWWRGQPWAGKSALLATFVLNPPPDVEVVVFFVAARLSARSDSLAFTDALVDQLSALAGEQLPAAFSATSRDARRTALLPTAVERVRRRGHTLVLVVDGLDEDMGADPGAGLASIASLLPKQPPDGLRVIVSSRPDPALPDDVASDHPLRHCAVRELVASPHATRIATLAQRELREMLARDDVHRDVLGLMTAAGGGLTLPDLAYLTGAPGHRLKDMFSGALGRTVVLGSTHEYAFAHESLREQAEAWLDTDIDGYRGRIHRWAAGIRAAGWPASTPGYLVRGYPRLLQRAGEHDRMIALALDDRRRALLLNETGGEVAVLDELTVAQHLALHAPAPDLAALVGLGQRRSELGRRFRSLPGTLPGVWARLGHHTRAEMLARNMYDGSDRVRALGAVARAVAGTDASWAARLATEAEHAAGRVDLLFGERAAAQQAAVEAWVGIGDLAHARAMAEAPAPAMGFDKLFATAAGRDELYAPIIRELLATGDFDGAEAIARGLDRHRSSTLAAVAEAAATARRYDTAKRIMSEFEVYRYDLVVAGYLGVVRAMISNHDDEVAYEFVQTIEDPIFGRLQNMAWATIAVQLVDRGEHDGAVAVAHRIGDPAHRSTVMVTLALMGVGDHVDGVLPAVEGPDSELLALCVRMTAALARDDRAAIEDLYAGLAAGAATTTSATVREGALSVLAHASVRLGQREQAVIQFADVVETADAVERGRSTPYNQVGRVAPEIVALMVDRTFGDSSPDIVGRIIPDADRRSAVVKALAELALVEGHFDRAERAVRAMTDRRDQVAAMADLADAATAAGNGSRAERLLLEAEALTAAGKSPAPSWELALLAAAAARAGDIGLTVTVTQAAASADERADCLRWVVGGLCATGAFDLARAVTQAVDDDRCRQMCTDSIAEWASRTAAGPTLDDQPDPEVAATAAAISTGDLDLAKALAAAAPGRWPRVTALRLVVTALADGGRYDEAETVARSIRHPRPWWTGDEPALATVAAALFVAGDRDRATTIIESIADPHDYASALETVAGSLVSAGRYREALPVAMTIGMLPRREQAILATIRAAVAAGDLAWAMEVVQRADAEWRIPAAQALCEVVETATARGLVAWSLTTGDWVDSLPLLAMVDPAFTAQVVRERLRAIAQ